MVVLDTIKFNKYKSRIGWIDAARGISILIIVYAHIYDESQISEFVHLFHVPVFFFLSGMVWKQSPNIKKTAFNLFYKLMIPYYICSIISIAVYTVLGKFFTHNAESLPVIKCLAGMLYANSKTGLMIWNRPLWFIPCLFIMKLIWEVISKKELWKFNRNITVLLLFVIGLVWSYSPMRAIKAPFQLEVSLVMILFYALGVECRKLFDDKNISFEKINPLFISGGIVFSFIVCLLVYKFNDRISVQYSIYNNFVLFFAGAAFGITMLVLASVNMRKLKLLQVLGQNTLSVLLWHKFPILLFQTTGIGKSFLKNSDSITAIIAGVILMIFSCILSLAAAYVIGIISDWLDKKTVKSTE